MYNINDSSAVTLATAVTDRLRNDIITRKIPTGSRITIKEIAEMYHVSHMPVREAFQTLRGEKLIEMLPYKGAKILTIDKQYLKNLYGIGKSLEWLLVESTMESGALLKRTAALQKINDSIKGLAADEKLSKAYVRMNHNFHAELNRDCGNDTAFSLYSYYHHLTICIRGHYIPTVERVREGISQHDEIIRLIREGTLAELQRLLIRHSEDALSDLMTKF